MHDFQLELIRALHQIRTPALDSFFHFLNYLDRQEFIFLLIPTVWMGVHWKAGLRLFYILVLSGLVNYTLKQFFAHPRPFHLDPTLAVIQVGGYGFPSGAAQTAVLLSGIILYYFQSKWKWILALNFFFWLSLSRVYLGVHFLTDILGGWCIGALLLALFIYARPPLEKLSRNTLFLLSQAFPLLLLCFSHSPIYLRLCTVSMAVGIGVFIGNRYTLFLQPTHQLKVKTLRALLGTGGTFLLYGITTLLPMENQLVKIIVQFALLGLWLSIGATWTWLTLKGKKTC